MARGKRKKATPERRQEAPSPSRTARVAKRMKAESAAVDLAEFIQKYEHAGLDELIAMIEYARGRVYMLERKYDFTVVEAGE